MTRITKEAWMVELAKVVALRSTCIKRAVGAVVFDTDGQVVSTGYNGPPSGQPHCIDVPCKAIGMKAPESHLACRASHAEENALLRAGRKAKGGTLAITTTPCYNCAKMIVNSGINVIITAEINRLYDKSNTLYSETPAELFKSAGILLKEIKL